MINSMRTCTSYSLTRRQNGKYQIIILSEIYGWFFLGADSGIALVFYSEFCSSSLVLLMFSELMCSFFVVYCDDGSLSAWIWHNSSAFVYFYRPILSRMWRMSFFAVAKFNRRDYHLNGMSATWFGSRSHLRPNIKHFQRLNDSNSGRILFWTKNAVQCVVRHSLSFEIRVLVGVGAASNESWCWKNAVHDWADWCLARLLSWWNLMDKWCTQVLLSKIRVEH